MSTSRAWTVLLLALAACAVEAPPEAPWHGRPPAAGGRHDDGPRADSAGTMIGDVSTEPPVDPVEVVVPAALGWTPDFPIWQLDAHTFRPELDLASLRATTAQTLYVSLRGDDGNAGTSPGAGAKRTILGAVAVPGSKTILVEPGTYYGFFGAGITTDTNVIAVGDGPVILTEEVAVPAWTPVGSGAYAATIPGPYSQPYGVADDAFADQYGVPAWLAPRGSVAEVKALGGWYWAAGVLTVKATDARPADGQLHAYPAGLNGFVVGAPGVTFYIEGIEIRGGTHGVWAHDAARVSAVDCRFLNPNGTGFRVDRATIGSYAIRTFAGGAYGMGNGFADGFNYSVASPTNSLEWDCTGVSNGSPYGPDLMNSCNGSSAHAGGRAIRIGGLYANNLGGDLTDVGGALTLNLGITCTGSRRVVGDGPASLHLDNPATRAWLAGAELSDPVYLGSDPDTILFVHDTPLGASSGSGSLRAW